MLSYNERFDPIRMPAAAARDPSASEVTTRPSARGKFLYAAGQKFYVRGVTYGTFAPDAEGEQLPPPGVVAADFARMRAHGFNSVRTYTCPPPWLLDLAARHGLRVMVGLPWEQHVTFLDDRRRARDIRRRIVEGVRSCERHPAVLCYAIGNEIPAPIVRWHGRESIQSFLAETYEAAKEADPEGLFTYVNFPTTEFLQLPFLDLFCFNVYLESRDRFDAYLARLHNLAGDRPVLMAEVGLDSDRNGLDTQAETLDWQIRSTFRAGCAGLFLFAWTDEWWRGGHEIDDWSFGLTTRDRRPKPALAAVERALAEMPLEPRPEWPRISVVVCTYNGGATVTETIEHLRRLRYPDFEIIVVNDGSEEATKRTLDAIAREGDVRIIHQKNRGLSVARNTGWEAATGAIVAYVDDDAYPDPDWLTHLASTFMDGDWAAAGGPNVVPPEDAIVAQAVAHSPGGPTHVLIDDRRAEHIPGCNMAFRREWLERLDGFDPRYRTAGDDVDLCWRLLESGGEIAFHPGALVWHHRRGSVKRYWKQQVGYGKAEALLEEKWPEKYNSMGHVAWTGRIYGTGLTRALLRGWGRRVYQGTWGTAPFQSLYEREPGTVLSTPLTPEWFLLVAGLGGLTALAPFWPPLWVAAVAFVLTAGVSILQAVNTARHVPVPDVVHGRPLRRWTYRLLVAFFHLLQPLARLWGRIKHGLTPWRLRGPRRWIWPRRRERTVWSEEWRPVREWLAPTTEILKRCKAGVLLGGEFDRWDLEVRAGLFGAGRLLFAVEEHGGGKQLGRFRVWPRPRKGFYLIGLPAEVLALAALLSGAWLAGIALLGVTLGMLALSMRQCGRAQAMLWRAIAEALEPESVAEPLAASYPRARGRTPRPSTLHGAPAS